MTYVYDFTEGDKDQKDLLGGKGANLAEMTNLGLPVPPGFTISTEACRAYLESAASGETGSMPEGLDAEVSKHLDALEKALTPGPFILGETFSAADVYVGSQIAWGLMIKTLEARPRFQEYVARFRERPAAQRAGARDREFGAQVKPLG